MEGHPTEQNLRLRCIHCSLKRMCKLPAWSQPAVSFVASFRGPAWYLGSKPVRKPMDSGYRNHPLIPIAGRIHGSDQPIVHGRGWWISIGAGPGLIDWDSSRSCSGCFEVCFSFPSGSGTKTYWLLWLTNTRWVLCHDAPQHTIGKLLDVASPDLQIETKWVTVANPQNWTFFLTLNMTKP